MHITKTSIIWLWSSEYVLSWLASSPLACWPDPVLGPRRNPPNPYWGCQSSKFPGIHMAPVNFFSGYRAVFLSSMRFSCKSTSSLVWSVWLRYLCCRSVWVWEWVDWVDECIAIPLFSCGSPVLLWRGLRCGFGCGSCSFWKCWNRRYFWLGLELSSGHPKAVVFKFWVFSCIILPIWAELPFTTCRSDLRSISTRIYACEWL